MLTLYALPPRLLLNVFYSSGPLVINLFNMSPSSSVFLTTFKHIVQDLPNHVAGCVVDDSGRWRAVYRWRQIAVTHRLDPGDVEHRVDPQYCRKL